MSKKKKVCGNCFHFFKQENICLKKRPYGVKATYANSKACKEVWEIGLLEPLKGVAE